MGASQHVARHQEEAWRLPTMIVEKTCLTLGICLGLALITTAIPLALNHQKMSEETSYDWIISEADSSMHMDAVSSAIHTTSGSSRRRRRLHGHAHAQHKHETWFREPRSEMGKGLPVRYQSIDGGNILTPAKLLAICKIENLFFADKGSGSGIRDRIREVEEVPTLPFSQLCKLEIDNIPYANWSECSIMAPAPAVTSAGYACACQSNLNSAEFRSALKFFYTSNTDGSRTCTTLTTAQVAAGVALLLAPPGGNAGEDTRWYVGRDASATTGSTSRLRSELRLGSPLLDCIGCSLQNQNEDMDDDERENMPSELQLVQPFWAEQQKIWFDHFDIGSSWTIGDDDTVVDGIRVIFFSRAMAGSDFFEVMIGADLAWVSQRVLWYPCL